MKTAQEKEREQAIEAYKSIVSRKVAGVKIKQVKVIKVGSITFII